MPHSGVLLSRAILLVCAVAGVDRGKHQTGRVGSMVEERGTRKSEE